jgi:hypothetical protein
MLMGYLLAPNYCMGIQASDGQAALPANYTFSSSDAGKHTFTVTLKTAATQSICHTT